MMAMTRPAWIEWRAVETLQKTGAALVISLCATGWASAQAMPRVVVAEAEMTGLAESVVFNGRAVAVQKVDLRARISGFVESRDFKEGQMVAAGDVLFTLEDDSYQFALTQAEASVEAAKAASALALIERDRQKDLVAKGTAAQAVFERAEAEFEGKTAEVRRLEALRDQARLNLSYARIIAPFDGRVGLASADVGALVGPESGALLSLVRIDPMSVEFPVPERILLQFQAMGAASVAPVAPKITLTRSDGSAYAYPGTINFLDVSVNQGTDTVLLRASFPNPEGRLTNGALVAVTLAAEQAAPSLTIPQQAVQRDLSGAFVLVVDAAGTVEQRRVEIARQAEGKAVISSGLQEGERVITEGANKVRPGIVVDAALAGQG
jgi:membrane fusion protein (multidrug efflux system)